MALYGQLAADQIDDAFLLTDMILISQTCRAPAGQHFQLLSVMPCCLATICPRLLGAGSQLDSRLVAGVGGIGGIGDVLCFTEYGWVSGWVSGPRECEGLPARTCARCLAVKDQTDCLKCAKANLGKNANLLTSALLSGLTLADGCAVCFNTSQPSKCTACLSNNQTCGQCTLQDTTNAAFDVMACINCNLKFGSKYSAAWWVY